MLKKLTIQNYAIIDELEIDLSPGMNVITGETGAGKSIIVGALGLILGDRADTSVLLNKEKKSVVEGWFTSEGSKQVAALLAENDLDPSEDILIRREVGSNGKSRAFINDTPVNLSQLQQLSSLLVDLHQQFDTLELAKKDFQLDVLDALAKQIPLKESYRTEYRGLEKIRAELAKLREEKQRMEREMDYFQFQYDELEQADLQEEELEKADAELAILNNAEEISKALDQSAYTLQDSDNALLPQLKQLYQQLNSYASLHPGLNALMERLHAAHVELQDIAGSLAQMAAGIQFDPRRLEELNERISLGYKLLKKHGVKTTAELLKVKEDLAVNLQQVNQVGEELTTLEKQEAVLVKKTGTLALQLSEGRKAQVKKFEKEVNGLLDRVGMPNARLKVSIRSEAAVWNNSGMDEVDFLFDANRSGQFHPLRKVASGGELSRLMLCIKSLVADSLDMPTMIFDEIDTGISGEAAKQVGLIMKDSSAGRQLISITHQPQIAGKADAHFFVYKEIRKDTVKTNIRALDTEERIVAIAKMLSGEKPTAAAMANAREMLN